MPVYTLRVHTGKESFVAEKIEESSIAGINKVHNPMSVYNTPVFPGYIFLETNLDSDTYYAILNIPFVIYFLSPMSGVFPIEENEKKHVEQIGSEKPIELISQNVKIVKGKYSGLSGTLDEIEYPHAKVRITLYNQEVVLKVNVKDLLLEGEECLPGSLTK